MKKIVYISILSTLLFSLSACNQWLDISPKGEIDAKELLTDLKGYNSATNGIYSIMGTTSLYGKELTYGLMDVYAQYWKVEPTHEIYGKASTYDKDYLKGYSYNLWAEMYRAIGQCNQILDSHAQTGSGIENSELFKGEALGLRAFLHIELLKMFGPVLKSKADYSKLSIPYRKAYDNIAIKFSTVSEVLDLARIDLLAALAELENDPINVNGRGGNGNTSVLNYNSVVDRRGNRMNVWAVKAILSRLEMMAGNKETALAYCEDIITKAEVFYFNTEFNTPQESFRDIIGSSELIFALYGNDYYKNTAATFGFDEIVKNSRNHLLISKSEFTLITNNIYGLSPDGSGADFRLKYWFAQVMGDYRDLAKVRTVRAGSGMQPPYLPEISLIKLPEIYYTAAECLTGVNNVKAMDYINKVRLNRGLPALEGTFSDEDVTRNIFREYRKEFFGEGVLFGYYKRHNKDIEALDGTAISATDNIFVFQIPDEEYEFSPNEKPSAK